MFDMPAEEKRHLSLDSLKFLQFEQVVLLGVLFTPVMSFRGTYKDFLEYIGIEVRDENIAKLKDALDFLSKENIFGIIKYDRTGTFIVGIHEDYDEQIGLTTERIRESKRIALENNLKGYKGWNDVLRVWMAIEVLSQGYSGADIYITNKIIKDMTGLDEKRITQIKKALINSDKLIGKIGFKVNQNGDIKCVGTSYKLNVIEGGNEGVSKEPEGFYF